MSTLREKLLWIVVGAGSCLLVVLMLPSILSPQRNSPSLVPAVAPTPVATLDAHDDQMEPVVQATGSAPKQDQFAEKRLPVPPSPMDMASVEMRQKMTAALNAKIRERTRGLYSPAFQQLGLSADVQEKVLDILAEQQQRLEEQAFAAAQNGGIPSPPSAEDIRMQQAQQNDQLRAVLGEAGFEQFSQYQATIPDRILVDQMNQQGANLSQAQSAQLLQILTASRQQIHGTSGDAGSLAPEAAVAAIQQQQALLQQTVNDRVQSILTTDQAKTLQSIISRFNIGPHNQ